jgi:predicted ester cyclase
MNITSPIEKAARNKSNYLKAKETFNNHDLASCLSYYAVDHEMKPVSTGKGREVIQHFFEGMHATWENLKVSVEHVVAEDNWVMGRSIATAVHSKTVLGVAPTNKQITATFWDLHYFNDEGKITQSWNMIDNAAIMKQIGLLG